MPISGFLGISRCRTMVRLRRPSITMDRGFTASRLAHIVVIARQIASAVEEYSVSVKGERIGARAALARKVQ
jgi:transposase